MCRSERPSTFLLTLLPPKSQALSCLICGAGTALRSEPCPYCTRLRNQVYLMKFEFDVICQVQGGSLHPASTRLPVPDCPQRWSFRPPLVPRLAKDSGTDPQDPHEGRDRTLGPTPRPRTETTWSARRREPRAASTWFWAVKTSPSRSRPTPRTHHLAAALRTLRASSPRLHSPKRCQRG